MFIALAYALIPSNFVEAEGPSQQNVFHLNISKGAPLSPQAAASFLNTFWPL